MLRNDPLAEPKKESIYQANKPAPLFKQVL
jgi:hypothetical protein